VIKATADAERIYRCDDCLLLSILPWDYTSPERIGTRRQLWTLRTPLIALRLCISPHWRRRGRSSTVARKRIHRRPVPHHAVPDLLARCLANKCYPRNFSFPRQVSLNSQGNQELNKSKSFKIRFSLKAKQEALCNQHLLPLLCLLGLPPKLLSAVDVIGNSWKLVGKNPNSSSANCKG
jgi:hypothetical protein